jgi:L-ascorbate metabolism protein UlaG (beta-lactamase superfamily)
MKIKYFGHACFLITANNGLKILTDPYDDSIGYKIGKISADIVTCSHSHFDHSYLKRVAGNYQVVKTDGKQNVKGINFEGISTFHDKSQGRERGSNIVFLFEVDGIRICHLGDLGHILTQSQSVGIDGVDILFVPVGGIFTIDYKDATEVILQILPKVVIPMHYKTKDLNFSIDGVEKFLEGKENVKKLPSEIIVKKEELPEVPEIWVMEYTTNI